MSTLPLFPELPTGDATAITADGGDAPPPRGTGLLQELRKTGALRTLDHALAQSLRRLDPDTPDSVLAAAALASLAVASGHAGFDPAEPQRLVDAAIDWPTPAAWTAALAASHWVAHPGAGDAESAADAPLVYEHGLVYLRRYREYERRLADGLRRIGRAVPHAGAAASDGDGAHVPAHLAPLFAQLFPEAATGDDLQSRAAATALHHSLLLVTGGPGTGKTTTITRMLVLLAAQALAAGAAPPRIALAAPTGRAAERMAESVRNAVQALPALGVQPALCAQLPTTGTTLHRLLGTIPDSPRFRHHADNPLPFDVVVVDEASMIDLPLMAKLVEAVPDGARLVLLGDPDQLPSVEAGDVLAGILRAAEATAPTASFPARHVHLTRGYRQSAALDLAPLAAAVREGDTATALSLLRGGELSGVHLHEGNADPLQSHREHLLAHWTSLADASDPADALARAGRMRILTAVREGPQGARGLNARIEEMLAGTRRGAGPASTTSRYFHGRLLLITENSYRHRLFNGDIGICLRDDSGTLMAWFPGDDAHNPRPFHPAALPAHDSAFAMTVHKAQGSEFDEVWLVLPERFNRVLSRELVYTGLTRARRVLHVVGGPDAIVDALARHAGRWSGLGWKLR
ncbi:exodeoxyribonuclease V subunit alpha [Luteimonas sp. MC1572]|uniref:exodeoxyribonuclease V subunit alpha n=1 Tax=Luteimonas sp. MC1572 TaxID=2799325 RepID=UPI0018F0DA7C|nr:exodeoxyribonuclease V subunit alpha [Luteimonas sp. MC1572]MBJ6981992.1 exodeoxyribonuclease V subunit alpha [Luteimonas sp. MC1572]QQO03291.1 exodeoxyribonuclease V subunit alpha [Luteimonas sp. MC1572]